ncbi:MAG: sulfite exporter TauE/SafE family protein [Gemmatimonadetes bacterium]|nr:sulfite exporter TauE/SafE family protein [Gemmatimonadota bacterium]
MNLDIAAIPLAFVAGVFGVLSPCVWPLVPVVTSSASASGRSGPLYLAAGLSVSFAVAGTLLTWLLVSTGLDPELFRYLSAAMLIVVAVILLVESLGARVTLWLSKLSAKSGRGGGPAGHVSASGQFGVGALLGFVWLPCVGPTLGAAIALASVGQDMGMAFLVMLSYGIGTAGVLLVAGYASSRMLAAWRPKVMARAGTGKKILGWTLLVLGILVLTGGDKMLEELAVTMLPGWIFEL